MKCPINQNKVISLVKGMRRIVEDEALAHEVRKKGASDFVTAVDLRISAELKARLHEMYPDIGFFSEEEDGKLTDPCWILDPIDGTTNLVYGMKQSSVSLGLYYGGEIVFGVVYNPFNRECYRAFKGAGAFLNGKRLRVSDRDIKESIVEFGANSTHKEFTEKTFDLVKEIFSQCVDVRRICSSALDLCYIADGRIDGYFEQLLKPWDIAAGSLILEEAGGKITDYEGKAVDFSGKTTVIASNGVIHDFLLEATAKY